MRHAVGRAFIVRINACSYAWRRAGRRDAGFTLLEILVVLAVIALAIVAGRPATMRTKVGLGLVASQVVTNLRAAREAAIANDQPVALLIDATGASYRFSRARAGVLLPPGMRISYQQTEGFQRADIGNALEFFVDGTSTGGFIMLRDEREAIVIRVELLSGTVSLERKS